jgi:hypothetical protein
MWVDSQQWVPYKKRRLSSNFDKNIIAYFSHKVQKNRAFQPFFYVNKGLLWALNVSLLAALLQALPSASGMPGHLFFAVLLQISAIETVRYSTVYTAV